MKDGVLTMAMEKGMGLLPSLIFAASTGLPAMTRGREISNETGDIPHPHSGLIYTTNYTKPLVMQPLIVLNFSFIDMYNSLV